jgi:EmrB/QacA subfamily drug resistance transporter
MPALHTHPKFVAGIVACAFIMQQLDGTVVTTALPQMALSFGTDPIHLSIAVTSYLLGLAVFIPISGWTADRYGGRNVFCAAIAVFTVGSILCGLADSLVTLTAARILQGCGGAMMVPVGRLVLLRSIEKSQLVPIMAFLQLPAQLGPLLGPPVGGFITTYASWRWAFLINIPIGVIGMALSYRFIEDDGERVIRPLDGVGFVLCAVSLSGIMVGIEIISHSLYEAIIGSVLVITGLAIGVVAWRHLKRHPHPILDISVMSIETFRVNFGGGSVFRAGSGTLSFLLPLLFQAVFGMSAFASGLLTIASAGGSTIMRLTTTPVLRRFGFRTVLIANTFLCAAAIGACIFFTADTPFAVIFIVLLLGGFFPALQFTALQALGYSDIPDEKMGSSTSIASMTQQLSRGFGIAFVAGLMHVTQTVRGGETLSAIDLRLAFAAATVMILLSMLSYLPLSRDVGADVSGHAGGKGRGT